MKLKEMGSESSNDIIIGLIDQILKADQLIMKWNQNITQAQEYLYSDESLEKLAASCMMLETIGELVKKIDKIFPQFLEIKDPTIPWKKIMRLRDRIAHGYFDLDSDIIFEVIQKDLPQWNASLINIKAQIIETNHKNKL